MEARARLAVRGNEGKLATTGGDVTGAAAPPGPGALDPVPESGCTRALAEGTERREVGVTRGGLRLAPPPPLPATCPVPGVGGGGGAAPRAAGAATTASSLGGLPGTLPGDVAPLPPGRRAPSCRVRGDRAGLKDRPVPRGETIGATGETLVAAGAAAGGKSPPGTPPSSATTDTGSTRSPCSSSSSSESTGCAAVDTDADAGAGAGAAAGNGSPALGRPPPPSSGTTAKVGGGADRLARAAGAGGGDDSGDPIGTAPAPC